MQLTPDLMTRIADTMRWRTDFGALVAASRAWYNACHRRTSELGPEGAFVRAGAWRAGLLCARRVSADGWCELVGATPASVRAVARGVRTSAAPGDLVLWGRSTELAAQLRVASQLDGIEQLDVRALEKPSGRRSARDVQRLIGGVRGLRRLMLEFWPIDSAVLGGALSRVASTLQELHLYDCALGGPNCLAQLGLARLRRLRVLDLTYNPIGDSPDDFDRLGDVPQLERLFVGWVAAGSSPQGVPNLLRAVGRMSSLQCLSLAGNDLANEPGNAELLAKALGQCAAITTMSLCLNALGSRPGEGAWLARGLAALPRLTTLFLSHNPLAEYADAMPAIADALRGKPLAVLHLDTTQLGVRATDSGCAARAVSSLCARRLFVRDNFVGRHRGDVGVLAQTLSANLSVLDLRDNLVGRHVYLKDVLALLARLTNLTELDLSCNFLGDEQPMRLFEPPVPPRLRTLRLARNSLGRGPGEISALCALLAAMPELETLDLGSNAIERCSDVAQLAAALRRSVNIQDVELADNPMWRDLGAAATLVRRLGERATALVLGSHDAAAALRRTDHPGLVGILKDLAARHMPVESHEGATS